MPSPKSATRSSTSKPTTTGAKPASTTKPTATKGSAETATRAAGTTTTQSKPAARPASSGQTTMTRRQARAWMRSYERRRRAITNWSIFGIVVLLVGGFALVQTHPWTALASGKHTSTAANACPAATATAIGPIPAIQPAATPPAVQGTTVNGEQGLQYIDVKAGCGDTTVKNGDDLTVIYTGWLQSDGKEFDSSYSHGGTFQVTVGQGSVIQGWDLGLVGMKKDATRRLIIPSALGYGAAGSPPTIPANANLIFDITVVSINGQ